MRKTLTSLAALAALALAPIAHGQAPGYPAKTIKIIVPFAVGGIADTFARVIGQKLADLWGQPVVIENKTGAGGNIGADLVAKAAPDGYTLLMSNIGTHAVNVHLVKAMPFDPVKDFVPIAHVLDAEGLMVVHPDVKAKTVAEVIALAKAEPGKLTYASGGTGTTSHLAGEMFKAAAKVDIVHVPYKGNSPAITDLVGGQTTMAFATMPTVMPMVKAGRLRAVAVIGTTRAAALPDVPTVAESGLPGFAVSNWIGLFAPAGTPPEIVTRLNQAFNAAAGSKELQAQFAPIGFVVEPGSPDALARRSKTETAKWAKAIRDAKIEPQ
jgi:tripartite-type tricarboxylate transporter receptor subunit TctC